MTSIRSPRRMAGITLLEMLVVVVVMFTLAAVAIPAYQGYMASAKEGRIISVVQGFTAFENAYFVDNGTYLAGDYIPGGENDFEDLGYRVASGSNTVKLTVSAGDSCGGKIKQCYKVVAQEVSGGAIGTYESQTGKWTWTH